jgi:hypothetical protein
VTDSITPPPELVQQWCNDLQLTWLERLHFAYAAGANQELAACCEWVAVESIAAATELRAARRPKPPSLKERALEDLAHIEANCGHLTMPETRLLAKRADTIRRALEALPE